MARWTLALLAALLGLALAAPAQAQWKWRDKNGQTQYSDLPPPSAVPEQDILSRPNSARRRATTTPPATAGSAPSGSTGSASAPLAAASSALVPKTTDTELEAKRKQAEADQAAKTKAEEAKVAAARADNCARAKAQMRTLDSGIRLARTNAKGEREFLDDKQRAEEAGHTRQVIAADCK
jgi:uncharacterized protein DUF4124